MENIENVEVKRISNKDIKIKLRCGGGESMIIKKTVSESQLNNMTMEHLLDDLINTDWKNQGEKSEISYINNATRSRANIFAAYFLNGTKIPVYLNSYVLDCLDNVRRKTGIEDELEICYLRRKT